MKVALICPSNMLYMPYVENYTNILNETGTDYNIINWDRFKIEKESEFTYKDFKVRHQRNFFDYFKYSRFVLNILKKHNYDKIIVFGIQLVFFINKYLIKHYRDNYVIDIRDYNRIINFFDIKKAIDNSTFTVLSSPRYKHWLPTCNNYVENHTTKIDSLDELKEIQPFYLSNCNKISVGSIGSLRDIRINLEFIQSLKDSKIIQLNFHGEGDNDNYILRYLSEHDIENVNLTGRYTRDEEESLYSKNEIINVLRYNDGINNKTALPNKLYNSAIYGKPMLAFEGTYLAEIIKKYNLGIVVDSFDNIEKKIIDYIKNINLSFMKMEEIYFLIQ